MRRFVGLFVCLGIVGFIVLVPIIFEAISSIGDYARITAVSYKATVMDEAFPGYLRTGGRINVVEQVTFDIHASSQSNPFRELWRELPEDPNYDGVAVKYDVVGVREVLPNGTRVPLDKAPKLYWDSDFYSSDYPSMANKWWHSPGPYNAWDRWECVLIYVNIYRATVTYEIEYEMYNASLRYGDCSSLYISMYSGDTIRNLKSFEAQILFPDTLMPDDGNYYAWTYGTNSHSFPFEKSTTLNPGFTTFHIELDKSQLKFKPYNQYIEFALVSHGVDAYKFTYYASINDYYNVPVLAGILTEQKEYEALPETWRNIKVTTFLVCCAIAIGVLLFIFLVDRRLKKKHKFCRSQQHIDLYREIPSDMDTNFAGALAFSKHKLSCNVPGGYAAAMMSLVNKGYIEVDRINATRGWLPENIKIMLKHGPVPTQAQMNFCQQTGKKLNHPTMPNRKPLTQIEDQYYQLIFRHASANRGEIALSLFQIQIEQDYDYTHSFVKNTKGAVKSMGVSQGYFQKAEYKELKVWAQAPIWLLIVFAVLVLCINIMSYMTRLDFAFGAFFILGASLIIGSIMLAIFSKKYVLLTQFGEDEYAKWRGLYKFLKSETLMKERNLLDIHVWECYLIYATAFGISEKVIKALAVRFPDALNSTSPVLRNRYFYSRGFYYSSSRSFRRSSRSASFASRSGGYSAGRGGGGGGGGH